MAEQRLLQRHRDVAQDFGQQREHEGAHHRAGDVAHAAEHHHGQDRDRLHQAEALRADEALEGAEQRPRHAAEGGAEREGEQLHVARVDADRLGGELVVAHRRPRAANARDLQALDEEDGARHRDQEEVVVEEQRVDGEVIGDADVARQVPAEQVDRVDHVDALRAVGDVHRVVQVEHEDAHDLAEAEGDDGEVIPA